MPCRHYEGGQTIAACLFELATPAAWQSDPANRGQTNDRPAHMRARSALVDGPASPPWGHGTEWASARDIDHHGPLPRRWIGESQVVDFDGTPAPIRDGKRHRQVPDGADGTVCAAEASTLD